MKNTKISGMDVDLDRVTDAFSAEQAYGSWDRGYTHVLLPIADYYRMALKATALDDIKRAIKNSTDPDLSDR